jgi:ComF family protein
MSGVLHLFYPHICISCGSDLIASKEQICAACFNQLPHTQHVNIENNTVEKILLGRLTIKAAYSEFYFAKGQIIQQLIHELKYNNNEKIGYFLGEIMGNTIAKSNRFNNIDYIIPLPMFLDKEKSRGYNQAKLIADGISSIIKVPLLENVVYRNRATSTQTKKHRAERWENVYDSFEVTNYAILNGRNVLLVDDVITTGATLEACGKAILTGSQANLFIATLAIAAD